ncbi:bi-domain-containing oxidoreductase [Thalassotalea sp. PLHSN55]|uniref:bi-domain-containing oxidoreductase n=1 Tax=Thalassotalea sp. PLHSN55 TaxID=3435888 RepID=UPI003F8398C9
MKQIFQNLKDGQILLEELPSPKPVSGQVIIGTRKTLVSVGTERMLVDFGKAGWIEKARSQPDKVKMVLDKVKTDGLAPTIEAVKSKLDQPMPLGYCNVGTVLDSGGTTFEVGQRVVSNGNHAEMVRVPKNLIAKIPDDVDDESASYTVLGAIALQGIRLIKPTLGEVVVVTGLGLIGLLAVQMLKANGCRVIGVDFDSSKCELAKSFGAEVVDLSKGEDVLQVANKFTRGNGVDAVLITASSKSNDIMHQAATMCRKRGRIILVGVVGLELSRADFYEKELTFQVSCSYGPGRYDEEYEQKGKDYPFAFVRWTEQRNFEAVLDLMSSGMLDVKPLVSHRFELEKAEDAYKKLDDKSSLGIILSYKNKTVDDLTTRTVALCDLPNNHVPSKGNFAFIGAGNYASRVLIPQFKKADANLVSLIASGGASAVQHGKKNGFLEASTSIDSAFTEKVDSVVIATQHNLHAEQTIQAINAGKNVFVEKPLALTHVELDAIESAYNDKHGACRVMVGYNRRFAPHVIKMKSLLANVAEPKSFIMTMNAGAIPADHWTQDPQVGGGRIIGEACHYIDLMRFLAGSEITGFTATSMGKADGVEVTEDKASITLTFKDGSFGTIHYLANGGKAFAKERIEVFANDGVLQLDNFRKLTGYDWKGFNKDKLMSQDKGQANCTKAFVDSIKQGEPSPIPFEEVMEVARLSVDIAQSLRQ